MKKILFGICTLFFLASCGSSEVVRESRKTINGDWTLNSVTYPNATTRVDVTLLEDTSADCFTNSTWNFISNNNTGSYEVMGPGCENGPRFFTWSVEEASGPAGNYDLLLKPTDSEYKSTTGNQGFRLNLVNLTQTQMVWEQTVNFEGEPFIIRMNFNKN